MSTIKNISGSVALIAFALALPVAAEEQVTTKFKEHTGLQPVSTKNTMPVRAGQSPQTKTVEATLPAAPKNEPMPSPGSMPYITYDGAENPAQ